jgi:hypothetical protein
MASASVRESRAELGSESGSELVLRLELASVWAIGLVSASALVLELELELELAWALASVSALVSALGSG